MKCEKRRAARYANMTSILHEMRVRTVKRRSGGWHLPARRMEACRRCALRSAYGILLKKWSCSPYGSPSKGVVQGDLPKSAPCSAYRSLSDLSESVLRSAYGSLSKARILCGVGRKRRNGARLHGFGNVLPGNATMGSFLGRIFFGSLFGKLRDLAFC